MIALELVCAVIVVVYLVLRLRPAVGRTEAVLRYVAVAVAALLSEDSVIRAYGFYFYDRGWHVFLDKVPLLIVCIWPVVIDSAWQVAERIAKRESQPVPWIAALIVLVDASLIEPVAVKSGLWRWTEPGIFRVPPVGILGWALFTFAFVALSAPSPRTGGTDSAPAWKRTLLAVVLAPVATHAMLLLAWWGAFRWVSGPLADARSAALAWIVLVPTAVALASRGYGKDVPRAIMLKRVPGAAFFFVLLALHARDDLPLVAYAVAFVPPYLALMAKRPALPSRSGTGAAKADR